ncbi:MAG: diacylglycerol kinase family lipid kinase [Blastocatellales bacterium]|nr:diacylglycerol kinase family lipid kinase [Blastocatellales bacterium]
MLFIVNPTSARGNTSAFWRNARLEIERRRIEVREYITNSSGEAVRVTRDALQRGERKIIAVGGDGTLSEVVSGYFNEQGEAISRDAVIGLLPSGTGSDFRRTLAWRTKSDAMDAICSESSRLIDAGRIELATPDGAPIVRCFINIASIGLGGDVVARVNSWRREWPKWIGGRERFVAAALLALRDYRFRTVSVEFDGGRAREIRTNFLLVANGRYAGSGMQFAPGAQIDDGQFDVVLTDRLGRLGILKELPFIARGGHVNNPRVSISRCRSIYITSNQPLSVEVDGEAAGITPARVTIMPGALRFLG